MMSHLTFFDYVVLFSTQAGHSWSCRSLNGARRWGCFH